MTLEVSAAAPKSQRLFRPPSRLNIHVAAAASPRLNLHGRTASPPRRGPRRRVSPQDIIEEILTEEIYDETDRDKAEDVIGRFMKRSFPKAFARTAASEMENPLLDGEVEAPPPTQSVRRRGFGERSSGSWLRASPQVSPPCRHWLGREIPLASR